MLASSTSVVFTLALLHMAIIGIHQITDLLVRLAQVLHIGPQNLVSLRSETIYAPGRALGPIYIPA
jgi:hypothetical protein